MADGTSSRDGETSRRGEETSCRGEEVSRRGEALWSVGSHVEVRCCDLEEQVNLPERRC